MEFSSINNNLVNALRYLDRSSTAPPPLLKSNTAQLFPFPAVTWTVFLQDAVLRVSRSHPSLTAFLSSAGANLTCQAAPQIIRRLLPLIHNSSSTYAIINSSNLYGCETPSVALTDQPALQLFENTDDELSCSG